MSTRVASHVRQWVALPVGSCDLRVGAGLLDTAGSILKGAVGRPQLAALVCDGHAGDHVIGLLSNQLADAGFLVRPIMMAGASRTLEVAATLSESLRDAHITSDDLIVACGDHEVLSLAAFVAGAWLGGTSLAVVPRSLAAAVHAVVTPQGLDVGPSREALTVRGHARQALCDVQVMDLDATASLALAEMASAAMCDSERAFGALWDRAEALAAIEPAVICDQLPETLKSRGQVAASTSPAVRASGAYGVTFARALLDIAPELDPGVALGEGMRFCSRLSAALGLCSVDDVFAQDELLERLGVGLAACHVEGGVLVEAIRQERFRRTNRLMLELPRMIGRVRLSVVDEPLLREHVGAWCAARQG